MTNVLLSSGGMDSFFVAATIPNLKHVFVDVGQKYKAKELEAAEAMAQNYGADFVHAKGADLGAYEHESGIIPFRNAELILCAAQHGERIHLGVLHGEINSDKSPEFMEAMSSVLNISHRKQYWTEGKTFVICTPIRGKTKAELVYDYWRYGAKQDVDSEEWQALLSTVSCYSGEDGHCGRCASCFKRWVALNVGTGVDHGHLFNRHPVGWKSIEHWKASYTGLRLAEIQRAYEIEAAKRDV